MPPGKERRRLENRRRGAARTSKYRRHGAAWRSIFNRQRGTARPFIIFRWRSAECNSFSNIWPHFGYTPLNIQRRVKVHAFHAISRKRQSTVRTVYNKLNIENTLRALPKPITVSNDLWFIGPAESFSVRKCNIDNDPIFSEHVWTVDSAKSIN